MKRTIIAVISMVLILFAFSACRPTVVGIPVDPTPTPTPTPDPTPANDWINPMSEEIDISVFFDGEVSDIQRNVKIASTGEVTGTFVYTTAKSAWGVPAEESGYYFLFTVDNDGKEFTTTVEPENEGNNNATVTEPDKAVFLGATAEDAANKKVSVKLGNETMVMTFKTADFQRVRSMSEDTDISVFFDGSVSDIQSGVKIASTGKVTGTFAYTTAKPAWGVPEEESGYYFLFTVDNDGKEFTTTVDPANAGNNNATVTSPDKAVFLGSTAEKAANKKITVTFDDGEDIIMTFNGAVFEVSGYDFASKDDVTALEHGNNSLEYDAEKGAAKLLEADGQTKAYITESVVPTEGESIKLSYELTIAKDGDKRISFNHNYVVGTKHYCEAPIAFVPEEGGVKVTKDGNGSGTAIGTLQYNNGDELVVTVDVEYGYADGNYYVKWTVGGLSAETTTTTEPESIFWCYYNGNSSDNYIDNIRIEK